MPSQESRALGELYKGWVSRMADQPEMSLEQTRAMFEHWGDVTAEPERVDYAEVDIADGIRAMMVTPAISDPHAALLCLHGGGYVTGSMYSHRKMFAHFAKAIGCPALIVNYRLAPEHPNPAPAKDCATAYKWLLDQGIDPSRIGFVGDSAGGALTVTTQLVAREAGLPVPSATLTLSPWVDMEITGETVTTNEEKDHLVERSVIEYMSATFLGPNGSRKDPLANPLYADLTGIAPMYVQVGGDEALLDDARALVTHADKAGVETRLDVYPDMQHVFTFLAGNAPEADDAIMEAAQWMRPRLGLST